MQLRGEAYRCWPADGALAGRRFFHLGAHGAEIIGGRNHGKEDDEQASQRQQALYRAELAVRGEFWTRATTNRRERQKQPREIEQQFHEETGTRKKPRASSFSETD